jgi:hypothetical protein
MKTNDIKKFFKKNKTLIVILGVVLLVAAVLVILKKLNVIGSSGPKSDAEIESGTGTSITPSIDFYHLVERLWDATVSYHSVPWVVSWWPTGTNEKEVYAVLNVLNTEADYLKLEKEWVNYYNSKSWIIRNLDWQAQGTVPAVLKSELTKSELQECRRILSGKGISPDF